MAGLRYRRPSFIKELYFLAALTFFIASVVFPLDYCRHHPDAGLMLSWARQELAANGPEKSELPLNERLRSDSQRPIYWRAAYNVFHVHPWRGMGPGRYDQDLRSYLDSHPQDFFDLDLGFKHRMDFWQHLHSIYLQTLALYGAIGFCLWAIGMALLVSGSFQYAGRHWDLICWASLLGLTAFLIHNTVDILFVNSLDLLFATHLAITRWTPRGKVLSV